jgi:hypothetical protein
MLELAFKYSEIIVIRRQNYLNLLERNIVPTFIRHPYVRAGIQTKEKAGAVSCTRITYNKCPELLLKANKLGTKIDMYGELNNAFYYYNLRDNSDWKKYYKGKIENKIHAVPKVLSKYKYAVDMSFIALDGGGTQYSFLEAWDAGCMLIVLDKWIKQDDDLVPGVNCLTAMCEYELRDVINFGSSYDIAIHSTMLEKHNTENSGRKFLELILFQHEVRKSRHTDGD